MKNSLLLAALVALTLTACGKKEEPAPAPAPAAPAAAPAPTPAPPPAPAEAAPAAPATDAKPADSAAPATDAKPADAAAPAPTSSASLPAECEAYFKTVTACADKLGAAGEQFKQGMEQSKAQWASMTDSAAMAGACKQAADAFATSAKAMGC